MLGVARVGEAQVVRIEGPDARRFCNGMFTNNARDLAVGAWNRSAVVDDRARIGGFLDLLCLADDAFLAVLDGLDADGFLERFEKYVLFDRVELARLVTDRFTIVGDGAAAHLPEPPSVAARIWAHRRSLHPGFDLLRDTDPFPPSLPRLSASDLERLRVEARIPRFPDDTGDKRLPHELDLRDELLHFEKGCYLGQETIHRVDVLGQVRKTLVRVAVAGPVGVGPVSVGDEVVGELTSPVPVPGGTLGLAVLRKPYDAPGTEVTVAGTPARVC